MSLDECARQLCQGDGTWQSISTLHIHLLVFMHPVSVDAMPTMYQVLSTIMRSDREQPKGSLSQV